MMVCYSCSSTIIMVRSDIQKMRVLFIAERRAEMNSRNNNHAPVTELDSDGIGKSFKKFVFNACVRAFPSPNGSLSECAQVIITSEFFSVLVHSSGKHSNLRASFVLYYFRNCVSYNFLGTFEFFCSVGIDVSEWAAAFKLTHHFLHPKISLH